MFVFMLVFFFFLAPRVFPHPKIVFTFFAFFCYLWMFHGILSTFQILVLCSQPKKFHADLVPAGWTCSCGWSIRLGCCQAFWFIWSPIWGEFMVRVCALGKRWDDGRFGGCLCATSEHECHRKHDAAASNKRETPCCDATATRRSHLQRCAMPTFAWMAQQPTFSFLGGCGHCSWFLVTSGLFSIEPFTTLFHS